MRIAIGSDHAGYDMKKQLSDWLSHRGVDVRDVGAHSLDPSDDYPDFAVAVARRVQKGESDGGIVVCSTGVGSCIAAGKVRGVRAALCHDAFCARMCREHNDANVLCLGADIVGAALAREIVGAWIDASFSGEERHRRRLAKVADIETSGSA
jgi:ribose 5-phosphate isomerase B